MPSESAGVFSLAAPARTTTLEPSRLVDSSAVPSPQDEAPNAMETTARLTVRPSLGSRKSSGTMIIDRDAPTMVDDELDEDDVRSMSPRRSSAEVQKLSDDARRDLIEQAKVLQTSLQAIVERVESVREEHEKLEGGNKFLQSYIGELMQTSRITSSAPLRSKTKGRSTK